MRIKRFDNFNFINEEVSKNDPIPEITREGDSFGIIFLGAPGAGKSTFINNFIMPRNRNMKKFSTDEISLLYTKDPSKWYQPASELNLGRLNDYIKTGRNFVYDTTGVHDRNVFRVVKNAREYGYKIIFIQILVDLETAKSQNIKRRDSGGHFVDEDYIEFVYSRLFQTMKDYEKLLYPDNFYIVFNKEGKYKFFKYDNGKLFKRKVDRYVPVVRDRNISEALKKSKVDQKIEYLWDFFQELKEDGLTIEIYRTNKDSYSKTKIVNGVAKWISDPYSCFDSRRNRSLW